MAVLARYKAAALALGLGACLLSATSAQAGTADEEVAVEDGLTSLVAFTYDNDSQHELALDWGTGSLALTGGRDRAGRRRGCDSHACAQWYRAYHGTAGLEIDLTRDVQASLHADVASERRGSQGGPLLTDRTAAMSQAISAEFAFDGNAFTLTAFDRGGWASSDLGDLSRRLNNGEGRARSGLALAYTSSQTSGRFERHAGLAVEQATNPGGRSETVALIGFGAHF